MKNTFLENDALEERCYSWCDPELTSRPLDGGFFIYHSEGGWNVSDRQSRRNGWGNDHIE
jgi:hypothetical protein